MPHTSFRTTISLSRRTALSGVGAAAAALSLCYRDRAMAQEATPDAQATPSTSDAGTGRKVSQLGS